jgi:hypothetical protein
VNSKQEVFDYMMKHLTAQGSQSLLPPKKKTLKWKNKTAVGVTVGCAYRGADGKSCPVGCLIPDDEYEAGFEGRTVGELLDHKLSPTLYAMHIRIPGLDNLLTYMQEIHDDDDCWSEEGGFSEKGLYRLGRVADVHGISFADK